MSHFDLTGFGLGVAVVLLLVFGGALVLKGWALAVRTIRANETKESFVREFRDTTLNRSAIEEIYDFFATLTPIKGVPLRGSDRLDRLFGLAGEDVNEAMTAVAERLGRIPDGRQSLSGSSTIRDVVVWIGRLPPQVHVASQSRT